MPRKDTEKDLKSIISYKKYCELMKLLTDMLATHLRSKTLQIYEVFPNSTVFR